MKKLALLSLLLVPSAALAGEPADDAQTQVPAQVQDEDDRIVCRNINQIGSRLNRRRICLTQAQWAEQRRVNRADMENRQTRNCFGGRCRLD